VRKRRSHLFRINKLSARTVETVKMPLRRGARRPLGRERPREGGVGHSWSPHEGGQGAPRAIVRPGRGPTHGLAGDAQQRLHLPRQHLRQIAIWDGNGHATAAHEGRPTSPFTASAAPSGIGRAKPPHFRMRSVNRRWPIPSATRPKPPIDVAICSGNDGS
jgi:hypothetical protein